MAEGDNNAEVRVKAETGDAAAAVADLSRSFQQFSNNLSGMAAQINSRLQSVGAAFGQIKVAITAIASGGGFAEVVREANEYTRSVEKLSMVLGVSSEAASVQATALALVGIEVGTYTMLLQRMTLQVRNNEDRLNHLGVVTRGTNGQLLDSQQIIQNGAKALLAFREGTDRNLASTEMFGRNWAAVTEVLKINAEMMARAKKDAEDLGLEVGEKQTTQELKFRVALNEVVLVFKGMGIAISNELLPRLTSMSEWFRSIGPAAIEVTVTIFRGFQNVIGGIVDTLMLAWASVKTLGIGLAAAAAMLANPTHASEIYRDALKDINAEWDKLALPKKIPSVPEAGAAAGGGTSGGGGRRFTSKEHDAEMVKNAMESNAALAAAMTASAEEQRKMEMEEAQKAMVDRKKVAEIRLTSDRDIDLMSVKSDQDALKEKLANHDVSAAEYEKQALALSNKELAIEQEYYANLRELRGSDIVEMARIDAEENKSLAEATKRRIEIQRQAARETRKIWEGMADAVTNAFSTSIKGIIMGTTTLKDAMKNIWQSIFLEFVDLMVVKPAAQWLKRELMEKTTTQATAAEKAGIEQAASATTIATRGFEARAIVSDMAAEAAAGAAASQAAIPIIGPELAAAAFANMMALVESAQGMIVSAAGGYQVPAGLSPIARLHEQEMVLPREKSMKLDALLDGGMGGRGTSFVVNAMDAQSVSRFFQANGRELARTLRAQARKFRSSGR